MIRSYRVTLEVDIEVELDGEDPDWIAVEEELENSNNWGADAYGPVVSSSSGYVVYAVVDSYDELDY